MIRAGQVVSTDRLLDELWGEHPPKTATTSLQNMVSQLRKLLGADVLVTRPPGYVLQVEPEQVDAVRFERLVADARGKPPEERAQRLREALALWRGPPLADLEFEQFAEAEVRRLEELRSTRSRSGSRPTSSWDREASSSPSSSRSSRGIRFASGSAAS